MKKLNKHPIFKEQNINSPKQISKCWNNCFSKRKTIFTYLYPNKVLSIIPIKTSLFLKREYSFPFNLSRKISPKEAINLFEIQREREILPFESNSSEKMVSTPFSFFHSISFSMVVKFILKLKFNLGGRNGKE